MTHQHARADEGLRTRSYSADMAYRSGVVEESERVREVEDGDRKTPRKQGC